MKIRNLLLLLLFFATQKLTFAAAPTWSVNPASYQYSMTVTAVANVNCVELTNPSNRVGAFVGATCRGTVLTSTVINGRYIASMVVYSNVASGETITFKIYNSVNDSVYDAVATAAFQDNAAFGVTTSPFVINNNNAPTVLTLSNNSIAETAAIGTTVGSLSTTDADAGQTFTYSLVSGTGSTDNAKFSIVGNQLKSAALFNYNTQSSFSVRVRTTDNLNCSFDQVFTIALIDVNTPPTDLYISDSTVNENLSSLATVGSLSALDTDPGDVIGFSLVSGTGSTDNASFNIVGTTLRTSATFNYEVKNSYSIRVRATDAANNTFERVITILIDDMNDNPTNILVNGSATGTTFAENKPLGAVIGLLSTTDEDAANTFTYSFVNTAGNNNSDFAIIGNQLRTNSLFDYETRQNYVVFVQTNDGNGGLFTKQLLLTVTDSNDAPTAINLTNTSVSENQPTRTFVAKLSSTDPDATSSNTYTLVNGTGSSGNSSFVISNDTLYTNASFDYEATASYSVRIRVDDGSFGTLQQAFTINVLNANDTPTDINITSNQIAENSASNTIVGILSTVDQDAGNTFIYTLVSGAGATDNNSFNISGGNLRSSASFDYETKNSYSIRLRATDNAGAYTEKVFTIQVTDVIDAPTNITITNDTINENLPTNTLIGTLNGVTQDPSASFTYTFDNSITGNDNSSFVISGNQLRTNATFDFETKNVYSVYVMASVGTASYTKLIQIFVRNQNDAPTDIALSYNTIKENKPSGSFIGTFTSSDADAGSTFSYALVSGVGSTDNGTFRISNDSLYSAAVLNFELQNSFSIRVRTTDNGSGSFQKVFTIMVSDSNDAPTGLNLSTTSLYENAPVGTVVATLSTVDADAGQTFTYSLVGGTGSANNNLFNIQGAQLRTSAIFNFEQQNTYKIRLQTNDGNGGIYADTFTISILNANDAPTNITLSSTSFVENRPVNTVIGTLTTTDEDAGDVFVYSFANVTGNDNSAFFINGNQLRSNTAFDFETKQVYTVYLTTTDGAGSYTKQIVINILDSNDAPTNVILSNATVEENLTANAFVGLIYSTDADANNTFTYSLVSGNGSANNNSFIIRNDSLLTNTTFNFESKSSYTIRLRTTDNGGLNFDKQFEVTILNANDAPTDISLSANEITENRIARSLVGTFSTTDEDVNNFSYALVSGAGSTDNNAFVIIGNELRSNRTFNYEVKSSYTVRVQTNDGRGGTYEKAFTVLVTDSNDAPTNIVLSTNIVAENMQIGSKVCDLNTIDQDTNDAFLYSFANITGNNNSNFFIIGNELRTNAIFDYETKNFYIIVLASTDASGATYTKQFVINIKDSVDAPTALEISNNNVAENQPTGEFVGSFATTDADQFANFNYTLVAGAGGNDNSLFQITNDSLITNATFNFEAKRLYSVRVRVTDVTNATFEGIFVINVTDANDAPTALSLSNNTLLENKPALTVVGSFATTDVDATDNHTYTLIAGTGSTDNAQFVIDGNTLYSNFSANYENKNSYSIRVSSADNGGSTVESVFTISITDVSEKPSISNQTFSVNENDSTGTVIGVVVSNSPDAGANLVYSILGGSNVFHLDSATGELSVKSVIDYESNKQYTYKVIVTDLQNQPLYDTATLVINVLDQIEIKQPLPANNYMSPNNDGMNDNFAIANPELYADYSLSVYDENGLEVFYQASNYKNDWDGSYQGKTLRTGVYFFVFYNSKTGDKFRGALNIVNQ
jgi:gliding motility-associated-like protein